MVYTLIDHRNDVSKNVQNSSGTKRSMFDVIFWSIRVQTIENCCRFVFLTLTDLTSISVEVSRNFAYAKKRKTNCATITPFPWSVVLSNIALDQSSTREESLSYGKILTG